MTSGKRFNLIIIFVGALCGIPFSFIDPSFLDSESYLIYKALLGGSFFTVFICYLLDTERDSFHKIDLNHYAFDFTKPFNSFFVIGLIIMLSGTVCFFLVIFKSSQFMIPGYLFAFGLSLVAGSFLYILLLNKLRGNGSE